MAIKPVEDVSNLLEYPLLRDPFVLAPPTSQPLLAEDCLAGKSTLPFMRYSQSQIIGRQIEAQLKRLRITLANRFEMESNQTIMGMVAEGSGWTITARTRYIRAKRFQKQITLHPFPGKSFARYLSVFTTQEYPQHVAERYRQVDGPNKETGADYFTLSVRDFSFIANLGKVANQKDAALQAIIPWGPKDAA